MATISTTAIARTGEPLEISIPNYKASGILFFTVIQEETHVLLFREKRDEGIFWIDIGGRREKIDMNPWDTATRELSEELPNLCCSVRKEDIIKAVWMPNSKYILFCVYKPISEVHLDTKVRWFPLKKMLTLPPKLCRIQVHKRLEDALKELTI